MYKSIILALAISASCQQVSATAKDTLIGIKAPKEDARNYKQLTHYLCDGQSDETLKVNAIYNWITHNIAYDVKALQKGSLKQETAEMVFRRKKGVCEGYARLFTAMCLEAGIMAVKVDGYAKDWNFDNGDKLYIPRHCWNAVLINDTWHLVDVTWGAGGLGQKPGWLRQQLNKVSKKDKVTYSGKLKFNFHYDPQYFLQHTDTFRLKHLPLDPLWQLTNTAMPIEVFESGEAAILAYNKQQSPTIIQNPYLKDIAHADEMARTYECADRAYEYNSRFHITKAAKHEISAVQAMAIVEEDSNRTYSKAYYESAKTDYEKAESLIKDQKKNIAAEYKILKRKNKQKNTEAVRYITAIRNDNKRLVNQCKSRIHTADGKINIIGLKYKEEQKRNSEINPGKLGSIKTAARSGDMNAPELKALLGGIPARNKKIDSIRRALTDTQNKIATLKGLNKQRLEKFGSCLETADSALINETRERIGMHDNYDDEVKAWTAIVKTNKYELGDTLHRQYMNGYDAVLTTTESLKKLYKEIIDLHRSNLRDLEQYRKSNNSNTAIVQQYRTEATACLESYHHYLASLQEYSGYIRRNKVLFGDIIRIYERQNKITDYMADAEKHRKEAEEKYFTKKEAFDLKENSTQLRKLDRNTERADRVYTAVISGKKKRPSRKA